MIRLLAAVAAVLCLSAGAANAQSCRGVVVNRQPVVVQQSYVVPAAVYNSYVIPYAVYAVPGNPTVALNVYPSQFMLVQEAPPAAPLNITINVNGQKAEVWVDPKKK